MRYAAVDIGTNSCRLLIAEYKRENLIPIYRDLVTARTGEGLNNSGSINENAIKRTISCIDKFNRQINSHKVELCRAVATSAAREAVNGADFIQQISRYFSGPVNIITGRQEALLTYQGVQSGLHLETVPLVVDPGGGSTEFIFKDKEEYIESIKLGAVTASEADLSAAAMEEILNQNVPGLKCFAGYPVVFVGGTATTLAAIKQQMKKYDPGKIHGFILNSKDIEQIADMLFNTPLEQRKKIPGLQPERADIIPHGTRIIKVIMHHLNLNEIIISESDILEGIIINLAAP